MAAPFCYFADRYSSLLACWTWAPDRCLPSRNVRGTPRTP